MISSLYRIALLLLLATLTVSAQPAGPLRIATYNILKYPTSDVATRNGALRTVVAAMRPHVLVAQEVESDEGVALFRDSVLDRALDGRFASAPFVDASSDTEGAFFYDTTRVRYLEMEVVATALRAIFGYRFAVVGTSDTVWIYTVHLKAGDSRDEEERRAEEARLLRAHIDSARVGEHVIVAGDFNTYSGTELALQRLTGEEGNVASRLIDPLASTADWHNNSDFGWIHTQSPRVRSFGGGINGGMDDRFDMILVSPSLSPIISRASYTAFGNDGGHFNDSINRPPNTVGVEVAQALHDGSDHLPVYADFAFGIASIASESVSGEVAVEVGPDAVRFASSGIDASIVEIHDALGRLVDRIPLDGTATWRCDDAPSGAYAWTIGTHTGTVVLTR